MKRIARPRRLREGKVLVLLAVTAPVLLGVVGLVIDGGMLASQQRRLQQAVDAAATAAATAVMQGASNGTAVAVATDFVTVKNRLAGASVVVRIPPASGLHAGQAGFVEVEAELNQSIGFMHVLDAVCSRGVKARSVAGAASATSGAAIVVLDPDPAAFSAVGAADVLSSVNASALVAQLPLGGLLSPLGLGSLVNPARTSVVNLLNPVINAVAGELALPALPALTAGLEVEGVGRLIVDGAVLVNTKWGGQDENGLLVGDGPVPPYGVACMPLLPTTRLTARDLRVAGGVDSLNCYSQFVQGGPSPLQANRLPVVDPLASVPPPTTSADSLHVVSTERGGHVVVVNVLSVQNVMQPLIGALWPVLKNTVEALLGPVLVTSPLQPGVYDSITVISLGAVTFQPGVYVIRGKSPVTQMSLAVIGGWIQADGVMFYVTDSTGYSAVTGAPDASESSTLPPSNTITSALPSVLLAPLLPGSNISGIDSASSVFDGLLIYQRRNDRRPIVLAATHLIGGGQVAGTIYSKWGHVAFIGGSGAYDLKFVCGTMRVITAFDTTLAPSELFPGATDVFLVE